MLLINELLPNPEGSDSAEWVELFNDGDSPVNLSGWHLKTGNGKLISLSGAIPAKGHIILEKKDFKFALRNTDESVSLINPAGNVVSRAEFSGTAQEGKSFNRGPNGLYAFSSPTPGKENKYEQIALMSETFSSSYREGVRGDFDIFLLALAAGLFLSGAFLYIFKQYESLSVLFFPRNAEDREGVSK